MCRRSRLKLREGLHREIAKCIVHMDAPPPLPPPSPDASISLTPFTHAATRKESFLTHLTPLEGIPEKWMEMQKRRSTTTTDFRFTPIEGVLERMMVIEAQSTVPERSSFFTAIEGVPERQCVPPLSPPMRKPKKPPQLKQSVGEIEGVPERQYVPSMSSVVRKPKAPVQLKQSICEDRSNHEVIGSTSDVRQEAFHRDGNTKESRHVRRINEIQPCSEVSGYDTRSRGSVSVDPLDRFWADVARKSYAEMKSVTAASPPPILMSDKEQSEVETVSVKSLQALLNRRTTMDDNDMVELDDYGDIELDDPRYTELEDPEDIQFEDPGDIELYDPEDIELDDGPEDSVDSQTTNGENAIQEVSVEISNEPSGNAQSGSRRTHSKDSEGVRRSSLLGVPLGNRMHM